MTGDLSARENFLIRFTDRNMDNRFLSIEEKRRLRGLINSAWVSHESLIGAIKSLKKE